MIVTRPVAHLVVQVRLVLPMRPQARRLVPRASHLEGEQDPAIVRGHRGRAGMGWGGDGDGEKTRRSVGSIFGDALTTLSLTPRNQ